MHFRYVLWGFCGWLLGSSLLFTGNRAHGATPPWVGAALDEEGRVCAIGIAGRTPDLARINAAELATERALRNLAGVFETSVREAQLDRATEDGDELELERTVQVDEGLIEKVGEAAAIDLWLDRSGEGPFEERGFLYARACVPATARVAKDFDPKRVVAAANAARLVSDQPPPWLKWIGSREGARLCAVGYSLPATHPEATFENVVEDVRGQLLSASTTLVATLSEDLTVCRAKGSLCQRTIEVMTASMTEATSRGVLVNHFWFDRNGIGPQGKRRTTYGWGCTHPIQGLKAAVAAVKQALPEVDAPGPDRVRARAEDMMAALERAEQKAAATP